MYEFKTGDIVQRKCDSPNLKYIGVVRSSDYSDATDPTVVVEHVLYAKDYNTKQWSLRGIDREAYTSPKDLTLLVPRDDTPKVVGVALGKDHDTVRLDNGEVLNVPVIHDKVEGTE